MDHLELHCVGEMRLHSTEGTGICQYCGATSKDIKLGKAGSCEDYEKSHNKTDETFSQMIQRGVIIEEREEE